MGWFGEAGRRASGEAASVRIRDGLGRPENGRAVKPRGVQVGDGLREGSTWSRSNVSNGHTKRCTGWGWSRRAVHGLLSDARVKAEKPKAVAGYEIAVG